MNLFFFVAGLLLMLLSIAHAFWGERNVFKTLAQANLPAETYVSIYVPWHQLTVVLFASALSLLLAAFSPELAALPYLVLVIVVGNFATFVFIGLQKSEAGIFRKATPQMVLFSALILLIIAGILSARAVGV